MVCIIVPEGNSGDSVSVEGVLEVQADFNPVDLLIIIEVHDIAWCISGTLGAEAQKSWSMVYALNLFYTYELLHINA